MSKLMGTEIVAECLKEQGVDTVLGFPGGAILNIYDALYQHQDEITHTLTSHEQDASHVVDGYARAIGKVGVCMVTSGPDATNLVAGTATVYMGSAPMVAITCNVTNSLLGKDSSQEVDITGVTMLITKYNLIVKDVKRLATVTRRVFTITQTGHPGPVLVGIIKDVTAAACEYEKEVFEEVVCQSDTIREGDMEWAVEMIRKSRKPFIFVGGGAVLPSVSGELRAFAYKTQAPVADSLMGKEAFDGCDELYTGMVGMYGTKTSNFGITEADLLTVVGVRFSDRMTGNASKFARNAKILQLDIDPAEINKNTKVDASVISDVKVILRKLNARLDPINYDEWIAHIERMKDMCPLCHDKNTLTGPFIVQTINEVTQGDAVIVTEMGQHQTWAAQYYNHRQPRTFLTPGGLGTMGCGPGAATGAKMGCRDKTVINTAGDGRFRMNMNEIAIAIWHNIPVVEVIVNSHVLGMVRQWQTLLYDKRYSQIIPNDGVDSIKVAEAMGAKAYGVTQKEELEPTLREAISLNAPVIIDCQISCDEKVFPTVSPGAPIADAFDDADLKINQKECIVAINTPEALSDHLGKVHG